MIPKRILAKWNLRRILFQVHLWIGLILCLPLVAIGLTGSVLVFHHEIDALSAPPQPKASADGPVKALGDIIAAARTQAPEGSLLRFVFMGEASDDPVSVSFGRPGQRGPGGARILVDARTLDILGSPERGRDGIMRIMHRLHGNLLISGRTGREVVGWFGVAMLILGASGLVLWWPRNRTKRAWKTALAVRKGAKGIVLHRDLHAATGFWSLLVFMVVSVSGVYLAFPDATGSAISAVLPARDLRQANADLRAEPIPDATPIDLERAVALALEEVPDAAFRLARAPSRPNQTIRISLIRPGHAHGAPMITAHVDPWRQRVVSVFDPRDYSSGELVIAWQRGLHAGEGLGWVWKILVFVSGLLPALFAITGVTMWVMKRRRGGQRELQTDKAAAE